MPGGSQGRGTEFGSKPAIMAQEGEDVRDYNLTEEQKAIKAKYPPVSQKYDMAPPSLIHLCSSRCLTPFQRNASPLAWSQERSLM
uniref:Protein archease n=1 Tax=Moschus moschiferus TaxID=68415 RepID=A0A8C6CWA1_MOSMO